ncbi:hypothetical protein J1605_023372 [Eschrichtius robustus]|uniref:Uncharacterized protein n=1 Tax=Eschrichtius robustus TaxID=9764 RepID=A0AB34H572_ESCRO|nr:hypothetical protein J1605_023372 [Eschrichtius robustus]
MAYLNGFCRHLLVQVDNGPTMTLTATEETDGLEFCPLSGAAMGGRAEWVLRLNSGGALALVTGGISESSPRQLGEPLNGGPVVSSFASGGEVRGFPPKEQLPPLHAKLRHQDQATSPMDTLFPCDWQGLFHDAFFSSTQNPITCCASLVMGGLKRWQIFFD